MKISGLGSHRGEAWWPVNWEAIFVIQTACNMKLEFGVMIMSEKESLYVRFCGEFDKRG